MKEVSITTQVDEVKKPEVKVISELIVESGMHFRCYNFVLYLIYMFFNRYDERIWNLARGMLVVPCGYVSCILAGEMMFPILS